MILLLAAILPVCSWCLAQGEVVYEIFVRSFQDSNGDGIGDLSGVTRRLDYLQELGVTGIWLMPIHPSPSYHGYDVTDYYAVNPDYGTLDDFERLVTAAHARGIDVILDLVVNHTSDQHPWFKASAAGDSRYRDYYLWSDHDPGWRGLAGPAWHPRAGGYYLGLFWSGMPDLNYRNPAVVHEMRNVAKFWLDKGVDGFRIDAIQHVVESADGLIRNTPANLAWVKDFEVYLHSLYPDAYLIGETWTDTGTIAQYFRDAGLDMALDYPRYQALIDGIVNRSLFDLAFTLQTEREELPPGVALGTFISNHDQIRPVSRLGLLRPDPQRAKFAAGLLFTLPGTPFIYYGDEIGMPNGPNDDDEDKRTPMRWDSSASAGFTTGTPWHPFSTADPRVSVTAQAGDPNAMHGWYEALIALRQANPALAQGNMTLVELPDEHLLAFRRQSREQTVLVVANAGRRAKVVSLAALTGGLPAIDLLHENEAPNALSLAPLELRVFELRRP
ncbi:MAG TPA: alpha-amylase family glycosyl hydrolase [Trueperaceae bacterium]